MLWVYFNATLDVSSMHCSKNVFCRSDSSCSCTASTFYMLGHNIPKIRLQGNACRMEGINSDNLELDLCLLCTVFTCRTRWNAAAGAANRTRGLGKQNRWATTTDKTKHFNALTRGLKRGAKNFSIPTCVRDNRNVTLPRIWYQMWWCQIWFN